MKRRIALLTALSVLAMSLSAFAQSFSDMPKTDSEYYAAFEYAVNNRIITGVDGKLLPDSPVTLAEALTFISRVKPLGTQKADLSAVVDVKPTDWYYDTICLAAGSALISPDSAGMLYPAKTLTRRAAWDLLAKTLAPEQPYTPVSNGENIATRADFVFWLYDFISPKTPADPTVPSGEAVSEVPTEAPTEFTDLKAQAAQEAMQLALGIRADGSSYVEHVVYKDTGSSGWMEGISSVSSSSRPGNSSGSSSSGNNNKDEEPTTQPPTEPETPAPTEPDTQAPTEPETPEPTYGEYDGPIDNDKDNVTEDPFDDGWRPPGWVGGDDNDDGGGYDQEDDFTMNDAEEPDEYGSDEPSSAEPTEEPSSTEPTEEPSSTEPTDEPSSTEPTDEPSSTEPTDEPSSTEPTDEPSSTEPTEEPSSAEPTEEPSSSEPTEEPSSTEPTDEPSSTEPTEEPSSSESTDEPSSTEPTEEPSATPPKTPEEDEAENDSSDIGEDDTASDENDLSDKDR